MTVLRQINDAFKTKQANPCDFSARTPRQSKSMRPDKAQLFWRVFCDAT
jgi:hypothetical protein